jgi:hypothetical protein
MNTSSCLLFVAGIAVSAGALAAPTPCTGECFTAGQYYEEAYGSSSVELGPVTVSEGVLPSGDGTGVRVVNCSGDAQLDIHLRESHDNFLPPANIDIRRVCSETGDALPTKVCITFTSDDVLWEAVRDFDSTTLTYTVVDSQLTIVDQNAQTVILSSPLGIERVVIAHGVDVCIHQICVDCPDADKDFRRGDANGDGTVDLADALRTLGYLFGSERRPPCLDASDANDDTAIDLADALTTLRYLFGRGRTLPAPGVHRCGSDPTPSIGCDHYAACR